MVAEARTGSLVHWAMTAVLTAVLALAALGFVDGRNETRQNTKDIADLKEKTVAELVEADATTSSRLTLLEDHYATIREQNVEILTELHELNRASRGLAPARSGHSTHVAPLVPSRSDVLNGN